MFSAFSLSLSLAESFASTVPTTGTETVAKALSAATATTGSSVVASLPTVVFVVPLGPEGLGTVHNGCLRWDDHQELQFYSERVKLLFCAIYTTVNKLGEMASAVQNRDVKKHLIELWIALRSMMTEAEWVRSQHLPTMDEYMRNANVSYILGPIVLPSLYSVGQELSESVVKDQEYNELFMLMSTCGRLLNDIQGFEVFVPFMKNTHDDLS